MQSIHRFPILTAKYPLYVGFFLRRQQNAVTRKLNGPTIIDKLKQHHETFSGTVIKVHKTALSEVKL